MKVDLNGKVAVITASSKGIGFGIAELFLKSGARVVMCARNEESLAKARQDLGGNGDDILTLPGDIAELAFLESLVESARQRFGGVDILINNSGGPPPGEALAMTEDQWSKAIDTNLLSVVRLCRLIVPFMKEKGWGRIINLASTAAKEPGPGMVLSNVTRAGVAAYSKTLAHEVGPFGITVNTILTGGVLTDRLYSLVKSKTDGTPESIEKTIKEIQSTIPVRHLATPEEFAKTILFLASADSSYLTGVAIPLDGGTSKSIF